MDRKTRKIIAKIIRNSPRASEDALAQRQSFANRIRHKQEDGYVYLVVGGRDCDGVAYEGLKTLMKAVPRAIEKRIDEMYESADGPMHFTIMTPFDGEVVRYSSRDLGLEAFENGHPHVLYV